MATAGDLTSFATVNVTPSSGAIPGDVDGTGVVNTLDALLAARAAVGITTLTRPAFQATDLNHDGTIGLGRPPNNTD